MNAKHKLHQAKLAKWTALIQDQHASGLTVKDWCSQNNLSIHAYNYWKHVLKESVVNSAIPDIVPITPTSFIPATTPGDISNTPSAPVTNGLRELRDSRDTFSSISVVLGDIRIEIGANASDEMISSIIKAVRHA